MFSVTPVFCYNSGSDFKPEFLSLGMAATLDDGL